MAARGARGSSVVPAVIVAAVIFGALAADRAWLHWYVPDQDARIASLRSELDARASSMETDVTALGRRVDLAEQNIDNVNSTTSSAFDEDGFLRDVRLSNAVTILSLLSAYGGFQSTTSAAGRACSDYFMFGDGSVTDCGFQRAD